MSDLLDRLQDMVAFKHDDMSVAQEAIDRIESQAARIAEFEAAIYQYVNHVVSYEGISFIDEMNEPLWAKLINDTWVKQAALKGGKKDG